MFRSIQITARRSFLVNRSQYQKFPPISDDHSLKHVPKINFGSAKEAKKSFIRKTLGVVKILLGGVVGTFLLGATYVVVSEYLEDFKGLSEEEDLNMESKGFTSKLAEADVYPTLIWPSQLQTPDLELKPKLVILGSGWGAIGLLKNLEKGKYEILVVSPSNYFLFTPLLPSVTVGTLEPRSLLEPVRRILRRFSAGSAFFFQASAVDVDINAKKVLVKGADGSFFHVPYDHLVVAVGSRSNSMGVKGLEYANFLHSIQDAREIRAKIFDLLESASLPTVTPEEKKKMLSFVICGGGPTGVEFAAELEDFITTDVASYFANICKYISISIIQSQEHILNTYDEKISLYTESRFKNRKMNVITNSRVLEIKKDEVIYSTKSQGGLVVESKMPYGLVLWSTGVGMQPLVSELSKKLDQQTRSRALTVDSHLRVVGVPDGSILAAGDCASVETPRLIPKLMELFSSGDTNKDGFLDFKEFSKLAKKIAKDRPQVSVHLSKLSDLFNRHDIDRSGTLDLKELESLLKEIDDETTSLPATAQVANQQGKYLAKYFSALARGYELSAKPCDDASPKARSEAASKFADSTLSGFSYHHLGSLAYIGNSAVAELESPVSTLSTSKLVLAGFSAMYLWRSIYWSEQVSLRTRLLLSLDWTKRIIFGRDISKF